MPDTTLTCTAWEAKAQYHGYATSVLAFDLPEGILVLDYTNHLDLPRPPGLVRTYFAPSDMEVSKKAEIQVPLALREAAVAAHAAQQQLSAFAEFLR